MEWTNVNKQSQTPKYVSLKEAQQQTQSSLRKDESEIVRSKVLVIENLSVTIVQNMDEDVDFKINTVPGMLSDNKTIPNLDITAKEEIDFDEDLTRRKLESIIRRCGILEQYADYFVRDPDIVINSYTLNVKKNFRFFDEFLEGVLTVSDIFT